MNAESLKQEIIQYAHQIGIDKIGFTTAEPFLLLKKQLIEHREKGFSSGFEEPDIDKRTHPELTMAEAKSIIAIAVAYPSKLENAPEMKPEEYRGFVSRSAWGKDYHHVLRERLKRLGDFILERVPDAKLVPMVDTGVLVDRAVAERAGIGWVGKNCSLITPEFGSYVYLGEMITNLEFPPDQPMENRCGDCEICLTRCPTQAFVQPGQLNAKRCLAYITQVKEQIPEYYREKLGNRIYGCDTCQQVCPYNRRVHFSHQEEFKPDHELVRPALIPLLHIGKREFNEKWGSTAAAWRGKKPIQRNAIIALAHYKDQTAIPHLIKLLKEDERPIIRGTSAWALVKIGGDGVKEALEEAIKREKDPSVIHEIEQGLKRLSQR